MIGLWTPTRVFVELLVAIAVGERWPHELAVSIDSRQPSPGEKADRAPDRGCDHFARIATQLCGRSDCRQLADWTPMTYSEKQSRRWNQRGLPRRSAAGSPSQRASACSGSRRSTIALGNCPGDHAHRLAMWRRGRHYRKAKPGCSGLRGEGPALCGDPQRIKQRSGPNRTDAARSCSGFESTDTRAAVIDCLYRGGLPGDITEIQVDHRGFGKKVVTVRTACWQGGHAAIEQA